MEALCLLGKYPVIRLFLVIRGDLLTMKIQRQRGPYMFQATDIRYGHRLYCNKKQPTPSVNIISIEKRSFGDYITS